ncbi:MAG TPA: hypothetical protein PLJ60_14645 [Chryseolinea sp.]|nr:hypothetical protein [Chryseolinea sp.]
MERFATLDWVVIAIYFVVIAALAIWVMTRKQQTTEDYFLAGRNMGWFVVGAYLRFKHWLGTRGGSGWCRSWWKNPHAYL